MPIIGEQGHAADERHAEHDRRHHDRRAEVALAEAGAGGEAGEQQQRLEAATDVGQVVLAAHEQVGGEEHDGELEELRRLHREVAEGDPRPGVVERSRSPARTAASMPTPASTSSGTARRRSHTRLTRRRDDQADRAEPGPHRWRLKMS